MLIALTPVLSAQESEQKLYRIHVKDFSLIRSIENKGVTVYNVNPDSSIEVLARPDQINHLGIEGAEVEFIANSFRELYQDELSLKSIPPFHNYQNTLDALKGIANRFPAFTRLDTIGFSVLGRAILCLKISDNPEVDEDEPPLFFAGNHHGNEVHSVEIALYEINYLVDNYGTDPEVTQWVNSMEIWYVPMTNPDGREAMQRGNAHGVDLNRNYSFGWTPAGDHGTAAFSEPETRAIRDFTAKFPPIMSLSYHTSGQYVLYPWTHIDDAAPDSAAMVYLGNLISGSITSPTGNYTLMQGGRWYFTAGEYCDYLYVNHNTLAYTVELGTSQAPDYSVIPEMSTSNLKGFKTMLRQVNKAGVTGLITDLYTGLPVAATVDIPEIDNQGKVPPRLADSLFGRYYRYLKPGDYSFQVSAPGYRTLTRTVTVTADNLTHWNIELERAATLTVLELKVLDGNSESTSGNGNGIINLGEDLGFSLSLSNLNSISASGTYVKLSSENRYIQFISDSLYFGAIAGNSSKTSPDTALFRIHPRCPDGEDLEINVSIGDNGGLGWIEKVHLVVQAPKLEVIGIRVDDSGGNQNGAIDNGETVIIEFRVINRGHQEIHNPQALCRTMDQYVEMVSDLDSTDQLDIGEAHSFHFSLKLSPDTPKAYLAEFLCNIDAYGVYSVMFEFKLNNIHGLYYDFEDGASEWMHASYGTTANDHDDWQLGTPAGKASDPDHAWSGINCWGNDMGWDSYDGTSWDGLYQANEYNYLQSPVIDCSGMKKVGLKFMRWLTIRISDHARIKVNGQVVWENQAGLIDAAWSEQIIDISAIVDNNPSVRIIFELETNSSASLGGWNIDDVIIADGLMAGSSGTEIGLTPDQANLYESYPSPFSTQVNLKYYTPGEGPVELTIYDLKGVRIRTLVSGNQPAGIHLTEWDGRNENGQPVPPGIYLNRLVAGKSIITGKMVKIRSW